MTGISFLSGSGAPYSRQDEANVSRNETVAIG
jgi:hypothetical protein